jgi:hypothetical protein
MEPEFISLVLLMSAIDCRNTFQTKAVEAMRTFKNISHTYQLRNVLVLKRRSSIVLYGLCARATAAQNETV